ncbi:sporozoite surface protein 2-like isoform X2 [Plodia interpunctella]|uniref:sporozoite surface protein 2-like isoform X2 n=1 Tax=Plodia interpunctella TaxID=58824 RepID=UPI002367C2BF|nr:sporozoite surface protein 2-like isoform X2 [Plodia interpunctella]
MFCHSVSSFWLVASGENNVTMVEKDKQNSQSAPVSVDSRFFDLGQLFGPLFSNFNQNRPGGNAGTNFPQNSQLPPAQRNFPQRPNAGNDWGNPGNFRSPQNLGFNPQQPNGAMQWQRPGDSNGGEFVRPNYPGAFNPVQRPNEYLGSNQNPSNWRPDDVQGSNQYSNQFGSNGLNTQVQLPSNSGQNWNQPRPTPNPDQNIPTQFPGQEYQRPNNNYPDNNEHLGNEPQGPNFNSNQGGWQDAGDPDSGTLDDISPQINGDSNNAILGRPVIVPTTTVNPNQIVFDNSSESPLQRQCVQDCPATPEYNPICGTNNVTYFNPGKFVCARNCGVSVYVARRGVCSRRPM